MNIIKFIIIGLFLGLSACSTDRVTVPKDCDVIPQNVDQAITIVCPHKISIKH